MFKMKQDDMVALVERRKWGTICTVNDDGSPYAIECTYFLIDGDICALINPRGTTSRNVARDARALFKICESDDLCERYQAISAYGTARFDEDKNEISKAWDALEKQLNLEPGAYAKAKARFIDPATKSPLFRLKIELLTGRANWSNNEESI